VGNELYQPPRFLAVVARQSPPLSPLSWNSLTYSQPFFTTKPTGEGTGFGLSISYDIVTQEHGGTITVDSWVGEFAEFTVRLPRAYRAAIAEAASLVSASWSWVTSLMSLTSFASGFAVRPAREPM
jgi:Histidine kinase-, DNA gyrase B-, and HSP90-like ATPase